MKKILIVNTTFDKGGASQVAHSLFAGLQEKNSLQLFFAYGRGKKNGGSGVFYFGNFLETLLHIFLVRFLGLEGFGSYFSTKKLIKFIKKEKFDLINLHNLHGYYINFFSLVKFIQKEKIQVVWTLHDEWSITSLLAHGMDCMHCKTGLGKCTNSYSYPKSYFPIFGRYVLKNKKKVFGGNWNLILICPSDWLGDRIKNSYLNKFEIKKIHNGINVEIFRPIKDKESIRIKYNLPLDKKIILFSASRLKDKHKGIDYILKVANILKDKNYLFVGVGRDCKARLPNMVILDYAQEKRKMAEIYALSDLYCFASEVETFSLTVAESLSCEIPVIGFGIPVVKELFDEEVGIFIKPKDEMLLAESIIYLIEDDEKIRKMGSKGRELIQNKYSEETFCLNYRSLFNYLLK